MRSRPARILRWWCEDRTTGRLVIAQFPNAALGGWLVLTAISVVLRPAGTTGRILDVAATMALAWWAVDEIARGVNPFRRLLGSGVLAVAVVGAIARWT